MSWLTCGSVDRWTHDPPVRGPIRGTRFRLENRRLDVQTVTRSAPRARQPARARATVTTRTARGTGPVNAEIYVEKLVAALEAAGAAAVLERAG